MPSSMARCTSSLVTRPPGPVPIIASASTPWRSASLRATGVTREPAGAPGAGGAGASTSGSTSSASPIQANRAPTSYSPSVWPTIRSRIPATGDSTSTTVLSVSIDTNSCPSATLLPSPTCHSTTRPFSIVWPSAARRNCVAISDRH